MPDAGNEGTRYPAGKPQLALGTFLNGSPRSTGYEKTAGPHHPVSGGAALLALAPGYSWSCARALRIDLPKDRSIAVR